MESCRNLLALLVSTATVGLAIFAGVIAANTPMENMRCPTRMTALDVSLMIDQERTNSFAMPGRTYSFEPNEDLHLLVESAEMTRIDAGGTYRGCVMVGENGLAAVYLNGDLRNIETGLLESTNLGSVRFDRTAKVFKEEDWFFPILHQVDHAWWSARGVEVMPYPGIIITVRDANASH
jgi:hypothetical protein